jgi:hypothetical protein
MKYSGVNPRRYRKTTLQDKAIKSASLPPLQRNKFPSPGGTAGREEKAANYEKYSRLRNFQLLVYKSSLFCKNPRAHKLQFVTN